MNELNKLWDQAYENSLIYKEKTKKIHDAKIKNYEFHIGDRVLLFNSRLKIFSGKLKSRWSGPFMVAEVFPYGTVKLSQPDSPNFKVNGHRIKHYYRWDIPAMDVSDLHLKKGLKAEQKRVFLGSFRSRVLDIQDQDKVVKKPRALQWKEREIMIMIVLSLLIEPARNPLIWTHEKATWRLTIGRWNEYALAAPEAVTRFRSPRNDWLIIEAVEAYFQFTPSTSCYKIGRSPHTLDD
ncbi:hypothetical protein Tco_1263822 [Tanacetum coccineum]